jgi:photosystem II stability/assembly factor-like uncharacterized protein
MATPATPRSSGRCRLHAARGLGIAYAVLVGVTVAAAGTAQNLADVLDAPPPVRAAGARSTVTGIAASGQTVIAVGPRGMILRSSDSGAHWQQVAAPVSADLTSVRFFGPDTAWVVGHDAVILKSADRGATWTRSLDGRMLHKTMQQAARGDARLAKEVERTMAHSATADVWPAGLLDLMFLDADRGFAVGAFGLLLATTDGGKTWQPWSERADNERQFHLYAISGDGRRPYIAGEQGLLLRLDEAGQRFVRVQTPYNGSYFGVAAAGTRVLVYGLRGNAYLSDDNGASWRRIETGTDANLVSAALEATRIWLATQAGAILAGDGSAARLDVAATSPGPDLYGAVAIEPGRFAVARLNGVATIDARRAN